MSERLAAAPAFALEAEEVYDEVPEHSPRRQLTSVRHVALKRPGRLAGDAAGDAVNRSFWYDGTTFWALDKEQNVWTSGRVPDTIDGALDWVFEATGTVVPLADFLFADPYARLMEGVQRGVYLGVHEAAGVPATTSRSSRRRSTGSCGSTPGRSRCRGSSSSPTRPRTRCRSTR